VYKTFEGGNDAIIAIHGPITAGANQQIGTHGTRISNGCIRMHDNELVKVGKVPDGTPFIVVG
jgi:lipoprotein-anchoring transpeptidase ErfK/SrfK